jgi:hypothetical protein
MNLDAAIQGLLIRLRNIDRAIEQFEDLAECKIASRRPGRASEVRSPASVNLECPTVGATITSSN